MLSQIQDCVFENGVSSHFRKKLWEMKVSIQEKHLETDVVQQSKSKGTSFVSVNQDNDSNVYSNFIYTHTYMFVNFWWGLWTIWEFKENLLWLDPFFF